MPKPLNSQEYDYYALKLRSLDVKLHFAHPITKVKRKAVPLQAWTGPEGSRRLRLPVFKTIGT
jgi:hypothetical protein